MTGLRTAVLLLAAITIATGLPSAACAATVGIADQKADMFSDPLFLDHGFPVVRLQVPWDVMRDPGGRARLDDWMSGARGAGARPLITFGRGSGRRSRVLPSPAVLAAQLRLIRRAYPWAREFSTWNEANHCGSLMCHRPRLAARYYLALRRACPACTIVAAEVLDVSNMRAWVLRFTAALPARNRHGLRWGLHNYVDANRLRTSGTRTLLRVTKGPVWLTETGGIVRRRTSRKVGFPESAAHAAVATRWLFERVVPLSPRIQRVYVYHWNARPRVPWDSGLIAPDGTPRAAFGVLSAELRRLRGLSVPRDGSPRVRSVAAGRR